MPNSKPPEEVSKLRSVYDVFELVRERPAMYIGTVSLHGLRNFSDGFQMGVDSCGYKMSDTPDFRGFHDFVAQELKFSSSTAGWANMILASIVFPNSKNIQLDKLNQLASHNDHVKSLELFYSLLDKYCAL